MRGFSYFCMKVIYRLKGRNKEVINNYFRKMGMTIGKGCNIVPNITTTEPFLISIGDNVTLAGGVTLCTHDNCVSKMIPDCTDMFGAISIGNNCFIGQNSIIMYGVTLCDNIVVAAGSVVTKSFLIPRVIIGGNPARVIGSYDSFIEKNVDRVFNLNEIPKNELAHTILESNKLIERST